MTDRWLSLFDDATPPADDASSTAPDSHATVSFGSDGSALFGGVVGVGTVHPVARLHVEGLLSSSVGSNDGNARALLNVDSNNNPCLTFHRGKTGHYQAGTLYIDWAWGDDDNYTARWSMESASEIRFLQKSGTTVTHTFTTPVKFTGNVGFFGTTPTGQQTGGTATAGSTYGSTEQNMLQKAYNCLRTFGLLS